MHLLLTWLILAIAVFLTAAILPGFKVNGFWGAIKAAAVFGTLNWLLGWLFFVVLSIVTLGIAYLLAFITRWIIMAIILKLSDKVSSSIEIDGFGTALIGALLMTGIASLVERAFVLMH
ncbi:MAG TPA: phage holin family protein [Polyangiaceae bacterium]|nr:phage holin family protein [Polyangiaceae bacterium]